MRQTVTGIVNLNIWDDLDDPYDHNQLAENWEIIAGHTHQPGSGELIDTDALAPEAVTNPKIAPQTVSGASGPLGVTRGQIIDGSICTSDIGDGCITAKKIQDTLFEKIIPLGSVIMWYRPTTDVQPPDGWVICAGQTIQDSDTDWTGPVTVPDFTDKFVVGAGGALAPTERQTGGSNAVRSVTHNHSVDITHTHTIAAGTLNHYHSIGDHTHGVPGGTFTTSGVGNHSHAFGEPGDWHALASRAYEIYQGMYYERRQGVYVMDFNKGETSTPVAMKPEGAHSHTVDVRNLGTSGGGAGNTTTYGHGTIGTSGASVSSKITAPSSPTVDIIPAYIGMLFIIKIRKPS